MKSITYRFSTCRSAVLVALMLCLALVVSAQTNRQAAPEPRQSQTETPRDSDKDRDTKGTPDTTINPNGNIAGVAAPVDPNTYKIGPNDVLNIRVWREEGLSGPVQVRPDGKITLPLAGEVKASGLTPEQLRDSVVTALSNFINKPEVTISVQQVLSKKYYISGEMARTGTFPLVVPTTVLEAVANAGGFREFANKKKIIIMRGTERLKFNYNDIMKGKNLEQNILLQDGDHIFVP